MVSRYIIVIFVEFSFEKCFEFDKNIKYHFVVIEVKTVPMVLMKVNTANHVNVIHQCFDVRNLADVYPSYGYATAIEIAH